MKSLLKHLLSHQVHYHHHPYKSMMNATGGLLKKKSFELGGVTSWHGCIDHKLELVTKLAFKDVPELINTMVACHSIVTFFNSSSQATEK
jgi:hypothetical protein